jgi:transposase-like protein
MMEKDRSPLCRPRPRCATFASPDGGRNAPKTGEAPRMGDVREDLLRTLRDLRVGGERPRCPHCACRRVHRWGSFSVRQRHRCVGCRRTFSDFTGTPLAYSKRLPEWFPFAECMLSGLSVRKTADRVGIHRDTAFRWRHALLGAMRAGEPPRLRGILAASATYFAPSEKGSRRLARPPRRRGRGVGYGRGWPKMCVLFLARSEIRAGGASGRRPPRGGRRRRVTAGAEVLVGPVRMAPRRSELDAALSDVLEPGSTLVTRAGPMSPLAHFCRKRGLVRETVGPAPSEGPGPAPSGPTLRGLEDYRSRFRRWVHRFRGVATRYLTNYLRWFRFVDAIDAPSAAGGIARVLLADALTASD